MKKRILAADKEDQAHRRGKGGLYRQGRREAQFHSINVADLKGTHRHRRGKEGGLFFRGGDLTLTYGGGSFTPKGKGGKTFISGPTLNPNGRRRNLGTARGKGFLRKGRGTVILTIHRHHLST